MPRVVIQCASESPQVEFPPLAHVRCNGATQTTGAITGDDRPIRLWIHELAQGAHIALDAPPVGHCLYVLEGEVIANGQRVPADGAVLVEHHGRAAIQAASAGAKLAHFCQRTPAKTPHSRAGGHVHIAGPKGDYQIEVAGGGGTLTVFGDSGCPTCELWLHRSDLRGPRTQARSHYHTDDEVILFLSGEMLLGGSRMLKPRTALAIDENTHYKFNTGPAGLAFINYRVTEPRFVQKQADGSHMSYNEREFVKYAGNTPATHIPAKRPRAA